VKNKTVFLLFNGYAVREGDKGPARNGHLGEQLYRSAPSLHPDEGDGKGRGNELGKADLGGGSGFGRLRQGRQWVQGRAQQQGG